MAERKPTQEASVNWAVVGFGIILLMLATAAIADTLLRVLAAAGIMALTFYWSQSRPEAELENPLLEQLHDKQFGLDRRKYGRLRSSTDRLLEQVRQMNRIAVEGREGKLAPRHAQAELDRLAALMRDIVEDVRRCAGVPTPMEEKPAKSDQPQVVIPKARPTRGEAAGKPSGPERPKPTADKPSREGDSETDAAMDELEARAEAEARERASRKPGGEGQPPGKGP